MRQISLNVLILLVFFLGLAVNRAEARDEAEVVQRIEECDYFIAGGPMGLYVLEWYGRYDPVKGDGLTANSAPME